MFAICFILFCILIAVDNFQLQDSLFCTQVSYLLARISLNRKNLVYWKIVRSEASRT